MQKTFVAITLALTLSCAFAATFTSQNYVKNPVVVVQNNETNYTNVTNGTGLQLVSINVGEVDLIAPALNPNTANTSANSWSLTYRKLDSKNLASNANSTLNFTQPRSVSYSNGYAYSIVSENDAGTNSIPQLVVYQTPVSGGAALARVTLSTNGNGNFTPKSLATGQIGKVVYVFYLVNNTNNATLPPTQINVTSFTIGGGRGSLEFNLTTSYNSSGSALSVVWGEALGNNQLYANWQEGTALKYSTIDVTKGTYNATPVGAWVDTYRCGAYSTDKKYYGEFCAYVNGTTVADQTVVYYVRFNSSSLIPLTGSLNLSTNGVSDIHPYGPYLAVFYKDKVSTPGVTTNSYDIYNLDTLNVTKARTTFLTTDSSTSFFRVVSGGIYTLTYTYDGASNATYHYTDIKVGQVLSGSYLTSVLGFIMTIVAGVLLF